MIHKLLYSEKTEGRIWFYTTGNGYCKVSSGTMPIFESHPSPGISSVKLTPDFMGQREITIETEGQVYPFILNGPSVTPSHIPEPGLPFKICGEGSTVLFAEIPQNAPSCIMFADGVCVNQLSMFDESGAEIVPDEWMPRCSMPYHVTKIHERGIRLCIKLNDISSPYRISFREGYPIFLSNPDKPFAYAEIIPSAFENGCELDARFDVFCDSFRVAQLDHLTEESAIIFLPPMTCRIRASHGFRYSNQEKTVELQAGIEYRIGFELKELLPMPKGWVAGDQHTHSVFEDGSPYPDAVMRAARCNGTSYTFLTDHDVDALIRYGVSQADKPGVFIGMPGQEIAVRELHTNILNSRRMIPNSFNDFKKVNYDIEKQIESWLDAVEEMNIHEPCLAVLNHPSHRPEVAKNNAYFRSWWVEDRFAQYRVTENADFTGWFDRLNRGDHLVMTWTTDSHDPVDIYAGRKATCPNIGDELSPKSVITAIREGRCFCMRDPGAILLLHVGSTGIGGEAVVGVCPPAAEIDYLSYTPVEYVELIADGAVAAKLTPQEGIASERLNGGICLKAEVPLTANWIIARIKLREEEWPQDGHNFEPLKVSGYAAFTNPIYLKHEESDRT